MPRKGEMNTRKRKISYDVLMQMAEAYHVDDNPLFQSAARSYVDQIKMISDIEAAIKEEGLLCKKEYVKGRENLAANPLVSELPKYRDCANRTLITMRDLIIGLGTKTHTNDKQDDFEDLLPLTVEVKQQ